RQIAHILPSSIPPHKLAFVKQTANKISTGVVITPAKNAAKIITHRDEVIIKADMKMALDYYLYELSSEQQAKIKAVIVKQEAPRTSHEAAQFNNMSIPAVAVEHSSFIARALENRHATAQFNTKSIPALGVKDTTELDHQLKVNLPIIIIDPQRSQIID